MTADEYKIFVVNSGSASLKVAQYLLSGNSSDEPSLIKELGRCSIEIQPVDSDLVKGHAEKLLTDAINRLPEFGTAPDIVAHRIVHGGDYEGCIEINSVVMQKLEDLSSLAPMHQPQSLELVKACVLRWPNARQVGVFDTSWHRTIPEKYRVFAIPYDFYLQDVKRYGFHGIAYQSAMRQLQDIAPNLVKSRIVIAHLGGGSSLCAVLNGRSINTTMGMTPLAGIPMAYRSGSLDPGMMLHLQSKLKMPVEAIEEMLWHESGMKGLSGESGDMRNLLESSSEGAHRAIDVFVSSVVQAIAEMAACIRGIDTLVFTGGIGGNAPEIRLRIINELEWLGIKIDKAANFENALMISLPESDVSTYVLHVDEEIEIAHTFSKLVMN